MRSAPVLTAAAAATEDPMTFTIRDRARLALMAAGVVEPDPIVATSYELTQGSLAERKFLSQAVERGFSETRNASWPSEAELADHGEVLFRSDTEGVFLLENGALVYAGIRHGWCYIRAASANRDESLDSVAAFSAAYPPLYRDADDSTTVPITFWTNSKYGPTSRLRMIESASWETIEGNYSAAVHAELARLMGDFEPGKDGQLLLWQGPPGTGKTWALRALASEWSEWAEFSYITDPDSFFVSDPSYMIDVLLHESYESLSVEGDVVTDQPEGKWRVLILEDTGELLSANAKEAYGQGLSRLLNVVDGMVGQGLKVLALVTTNDELGDLHPAAVRPGRCASQIAFGPLSAEESQEWLRANLDDAWAEGTPRADWDVMEFDAPQTLAELYQVASEAGPVAEDGEFAPSEAYTGDCASCGHDAMSHDGEMNDGACAMEGCDCEAMEAASADTSGDGEAAKKKKPGGGGYASPTSMTFALTDFEFEPGTFAEGVDLPAELLPGSELPEMRESPAAPVVPARSGAIRWTATLAPEGEATDDGRIFAPGSITWRDLPLTLMAMIETQEGHDGAQVAGRIDEIWREEQTGLIRGAGEFDPGEYGAEIARLVEDKTLRGLSVDIAISEMEIGYRDEVLDADGKWIDEADAADDQEGEAERSLEEVLFGDEDRAVIFIVREAVIGMATVCPFPAFANANIEIAASLVAAVQAPMVWTVSSQAGFVLTLAAASEAAEDDKPSEGESLTASAAGLVPDCPPVEWFDDPELTELTPVMVDESGRVFGHVAPWDTCHIGIPGVCTTAPESETEYAYFHLKEVLCDDGSRVPCGTLTLDTDHAPRNASRAAASAHYDNTGTAVADIVAGEDEFGIWFSGALRPDVSEADVRKLRGAVLSGDWRDVNDNLEMVGVLAVNVPGFPIPRPRALVASCEDGSVKVLSLIAAGMHDGTHVATLSPGLTPAEAAEMGVLRDIASGAYAELAEVALDSGNDLDAQAVDDVESTTS